jgi:hypothetical protein
MKQKENRFRKNNINTKKLTKVALAVQHVIVVFPVGAPSRGVTLAHGVHLITKKNES